MRKHSTRWWVTEELLQWKHMLECGDYVGPFFSFPEDPWAEAFLADGSVYYGKHGVFVGFSRVTFPG